MNNRQISANIALSLFVAPVMSGTLAFATCVVVLFTLEPLAKAAGADAGIPVVFRLLDALRNEPALSVAFIFVVIVTAWVAFTLVNTIPALRCLIGNALLRRVRVYRASMETLERELSQWSSK